MRSAPTLNTWMIPRSSVAMIEKLALVKIAFCNAPALRRAFWTRALGVGAIGRTRWTRPKASVCAVVHSHGSLFGVPAPKPPCRSVLFVDLELGAVGRDSGFLA